VSLHDAANNTARSLRCQGFVYKGSSRERRETGKVYGMSKESLLITTYARIHRDHRDAMQRIAEAEGLDLSDIIRRAVVQYVAGGQDKWAEIEREKIAARPEAAPVQSRTFALADYLSGLDREVLVKLSEIAQGLALVYATRRSADGTIQTPAGRVQNIFLDAHSEDSETQGAGRRVRRHRKAPGTK